MDKSPIILTGIPGWLGSRFLNALLNGLPEYSLSAQFAGRDILVLTNADKSSDLLGPYKQKRIKLIYGDLENKESLLPLFENAADGTVFHMAGVIHPKDVKQFYSVNLDGTRHMLELSKKHGIKRFVHVSSNSPCGTNKNNHDLFDENSPYNPYLNYGKSKMLAEELVSANTNQIETVILRPPWFYGPQQPLRQSLFFTMIRTGRIPIVGNGLNKRSMVYIDNLCQALFLAASVEKAKGQIYWIADQEPYAMKEIISTIELVLERDFQIPIARKHVQMPNVISELAYGMDKCIQSCGLYNQKIHVLSEFNKTIACNISKAKEDLGYVPHVSLEEGMRRSIQWLIEQKIEF
jgi:nucleoside-diphosphate-sugar epimerase